MIGDIHTDFTYGNRSQSCNYDPPREGLGRYGDYECDSSYPLVESSVIALKRIYEENNADFMVWMGCVLTRWVKLRSCGAPVARSMAHTTKFQDVCSFDIQLDLSVPLIWQLEHVGRNL